MLQIFKTYGFRKSLKHYLKCAIAGLFFVPFCLVNAKTNNFTPNKCEYSLPSIQHFNSRPFDYVSCPIVTRPGSTCPLKTHNLSPNPIQNRTAKMPPTIFVCETMFMSIQMRLEPRPSVRPAAI